MEIPDPSPPMFGSDDWIQSDHPPTAAGVPHGGGQLPDRYGEDGITLLMREPGWVYAYWEITDTTRQWALQQFAPEARDQVRSVIRILSFEPKGQGEHGEQELVAFEVPSLNHSWHIGIDREAGTVAAVFGFLGPDGNFVEAVRSRAVTVPSGSESPFIDEQWLTLRALYESRTVGTQSSPGLWMSRSLTQHIFGHKLPFSPGISSPGISSPGVFGTAPTESWELAGTNPDDLGLSVDTRVILSGRARPGSKVTINGDPIPIASDGSFTVQYQLDDTTLVLPIEALSADGQQRLRITPVIRRDTYFQESRYG